MPPPVPPSVNAGRTIAGSPISASATSTSSGVLDDPRGGVRLADPVEQVAERLAVLGHADRLERRPEQADRVALEDAGLGQGRREVEGGLAAKAGEQAVGPLPGDDRLDRLDRQRLEVDDVGDLRVGHDRGRVRVHQDRAHALGAQRAAGLRAGVVELGRLADDDRPGAEDQDGGRLARAIRRHRGTGLIGASPPRTGRRPRARRAARARPRGGTARSRSAARDGAAPRPSGR